MKKPGLAMPFRMVVLLLLLFTQQVYAQGLPQTDIWLANINEGLPGNVIKINPTTGYNNQPHFSVDGAVIYYTREMPGTDGEAQTDIAAYHLASMAHTTLHRWPRPWWLKRLKVNIHPLQSPDVMPYR